MNNLFKKVDSSDYIKTKRELAIYKEYATANTTTTFNPTKINGRMYNKNFKFIPTDAAVVTADASNCLVYAKNYELLAAYNNGKTYAKLICDLSGSNVDAY